MPSPAPTRSASGPRLTPAARTCGRWPRSRSTKANGCPSRSRGIPPTRTSAGERRLTEFELPWLSGYEGSAPVRIGNAASEQLQVDVYGEVMDALYQARAHGLRKEQRAWDLQKTLLRYLESAWARPDEGIWE